jgi:hypothetical protein
MEASLRRPLDPERRRLVEARAGVPWRRWGPYLAERAWGTVREDTSVDGDVWTSFPYEAAARRAYRWNEDGLLGICDDEQRLCLALALWNERDTILKERLFGLTNHEGNHGEDVKELYFYLDAVPSSAYLRAVYLYPQGPFPYADLRAENARRTAADPEFELLDTGIFDDDRFFEVEVTYAKAGPDELLIRVRATNWGPEAAPSTSFRRFGFGTPGPGSSQTRLDPASARSATRSSSSTPASGATDSPVWPSGPRPSGSSPRTRRRRTVTRRMTPSPHLTRAAMAPPARHRRAQPSRRRDAPATPKTPSTVTSSTATRRPSTRRPRARRRRFTLAGSSPRAGPFNSTLPSPPRAAGLRGASCAAPAGSLPVEQPKRMPSMPGWPSPR